MTRITSEQLSPNRIFQVIRNINDPEHPKTLEQLDVVQEGLITCSDNYVKITFTPTIPHCSMATLIGLCIRVKLERELEKTIKFDVAVTPGSHSQEEQVTKQLRDKERVYAALENENLMGMVEKCIEVNELNNPIFANPNAQCGNSSGLKPDEQPEHQHDDDNNNNNGPGCCGGHGGNNQAENGEEEEESGCCGGNGKKNQGSGGECCQNESKTDDKKDQENKNDDECCGGDGQGEGCCQSKKTPGQQQQQEHQLGQQQHLDQQQQLYDEHQQYLPQLEQQQQQQRHEEQFKQLLIHHKKEFSNVDLNELKIAGKGAFAVVWRVHDKVDNRYYAVKVSSPKPAQHASEVEVLNYLASLFDNGEINLETDLGLTCMPRTFSEYSEEEYCYSKMEYYDTIDSDKHVLDDSFPLAYEVYHTISLLPLETIETITLQLLFTVQFLHHHRIVHRDIKPGNVLLIEPQNIPNNHIIDPQTGKPIPGQFKINSIITKLIDFNLSKQIPTDTAQGDPLLFESLHGNLATRPPEYFKTGAMFNGKQVDLFAIGITILSFLFGYLPGASNYYALQGFSNIDIEQALSNTRKEWTLDHYLKEYQKVYNDSNAHIKNMPLQDRPSQLPEHLSSQPRVLSGPFREALSCLLDVDLSKRKKVYTTDWFTQNIPAVKDQLKAYSTLINQSVGQNLLLEGNKARSHSSPLYTAAINGNSMMVSQLLVIPGIDVNKKASNGQTPLFAAAQEGHYHIVSLLLAVPGINVNQADNDGFTPLSAATQNGHSEIVSLLLEADGIDVNQATRGQTPLYSAAFHGYSTIASLLLAVPGINVNKVDDDGFSPLYAAAFKGHFDVVSSLLNAPNIDVNEASNDGATPLYAAALKGHSTIVSKLLNVEGIDVNKPDDTGITPLYAAAENDHSEIVSLLLAVGGIDVNQDAGGQTPLYAAAFKGYSAIISLLLKVPDIDVNKANENGATPLFVAAQNGHSTVVSMLLHVPTIDANQAGNNGFTPLFVAARGGHLDILLMLLDVPGIRVNEANENGATPLYIAVVSLPSAVPGLNDGAAILPIAAQNGHFAIVLRLLAFRGIDVNQDAGGQTSLFVAAFKGYSTIVSSLLEVPDIDVNRANNNGFTPLFVAAQNGHSTVVSMLLAFPGIDINKASNNGFTPLYVAVQNSHSDIVLLLSAVPGIDLD